MLNKNTYRVQKSEANQKQQLSDYRDGILPILFLRYIKSYGILKNAFLKSNNLQFSAAYLNVITIQMSEETLATQ